MFVGHFALGFAAKRAAPEVSLGVLFATAEFADLLWPNLVLLGIEKVAIAPGETAVTPLRFDSYPWSHSLVALAAWGVLFGAGYFFVRRRSTRAAGTLLALVLSHWLLDFLSHEPDMPLTLRGGTRLGLGLWNSRPGTLAVELLLFAAGVAIYARSTSARDRTGRWALWTLVAFLAALYLASFFGPPPPSAAAVAWSGEGIWLIVLWAAWADRHRVPRAVPREVSISQAKGAAA